MRRVHTCTRLYDCGGYESDLKARTWRIGIRRYGGSARASGSYNVKRKSYNTSCILIVNIVLEVVG